jgi:MoxR-like ATPase
MSMPQFPAIEDISQAHLEARIRDVARRLFAGENVDDLETWHLAQVVEHCSRAISDIYRKANLEQILRGDATRAKALEGILGLAPDDGKPLRRVIRVPDELRGIGDRCLYDVGMAGVRDYRGLSLEILGVRSYRLAADILTILGDERELRDLFQRNLLRTLPIEEEIAFLRQCAARFGLHANLLNNLREEPVPLRAFVAEVIASGAEPASAPPDPPSRDPEAPADLPLSGPSLPGHRGEPREQVLSRYERILLFAGTDIEGVRKELKDIVIDQDEAVDVLCDDLLLNATGAQIRSVPQSYLLVGPTGVGKNHLMESLALVLERRWGVEIPLLTIEGPQYTYPSDINELRGATRGFIRSDEPGLLTQFHERASRSPFSILLVDEMEKAHSQLQRFFLHLMDRGTLHDNRGQELGFDGTILAFTSNLGYSRCESLEPIGYRGGSPAVMSRRRFEEIERYVRKALSPEFVARLRILRFSPLSRSSMEAILDLELARVVERFLSLHGLGIELTAAARNRILEAGFSGSQGARHLSAMVQKHCTVEVSRKIKRDEIPGADGREETIRYLREVRRGERAFESDAVKDTVLRQARVRLPYKKMIIDVDGENFQYRGVA